VRAKIIEVDGERRRLSLSLKRVEGGGVVARADDAEPIEGTPDLDLSEEVFPESPVAEAEAPEATVAEAEAPEAAVTEAEVPETPGGEASAEAPADAGDVPPELVDESIAADEVAPDEPGPGDSEGEAPVAPDPEPTE
jgi:small subunit ribosomal protein S1